MRLNADDFVPSSTQTEFNAIGGAMTDETPPQQIAVAD